MIGVSRQIGLRTGAGVALALAGALVLCTLPSARALAAQRAAPASAVRAAPAAATVPGWLKVTDPPVTGARAIAAFGDAGVVVAGTGGKVAVSTNGGATWTLRSLPGGLAVRAVAFSDARHGWAVGPAATIDLTTDGGVTWKRASPAPVGTFAAVAAARSAQLVCAIDPSSATIVSATSVTTPVWKAATLTPFPTAPSIVAGHSASDGDFAAAIGDDGVLITGASDGTWTPQTSPYGAGVPATLALAPSPVWGNGVPDLFAIAASDVQGSDDEGSSFASLAPPAGGSSGAYLGGPRPQLLVGGKAGLLERYSLSSGAWATDKGALTSAIAACAAGPGGVAYALSSDGHLERTLSYGAEPFDLSLSTGTLTVGGAVRLTASSSVRAPGALVLQARPAGGSWSTVHPWSWATSPGTPTAVTEKPTSTTQYRLGFVLGGHVDAVSGTVGVAVRSRIAVTRSVYNLHVGDVYRLTGHVYPVQPGRKVTIWTDRGGAWHQVAKGGVVALVGGSSFATRLFGTPVRQGYHLQVRLGANSAHLAAVSVRVRVTIR